MSVTQIASSDAIAVEQHYRVSAGPGAGKTHWLVSHIRNVLQNSNRLGCSKKIACITYTNIGADTIIKRLDFTADRVEVSTIHSFIYNHIIRPYFSFIAADFDFNIEKLDGHDEHYASRSIITEWIMNHSNKNTFAHPYSEKQMIRQPNVLNGIRNWLKSISYQFTGKNLDVTADNSKAFYFDDNGSRKNIGKTACLDKLRPGLLDYKKIYWRKGILHHEDVLYFGYLLLQKFPFIIKVIRTKFPYFFIDEFQDTNPIQSEILRLLGQSETKVGIIGDPAQSIYEFQGASPKDFQSFDLADLSDFKIADNRRSTNKIIEVLNHIRPDLQQNPARQVDGDRPKIFIGELSWAINKARAEINGDQLVTLSRDNLTANAIKKNFEPGKSPKDLIEALLSIDSNSDRRKVLVSCISAVEQGRERRYKDAIKELSKNFRSIADKDKRRKVAFGKLQILLTKYDDYARKSLMNFYDLVKSVIRPDISKFRQGNIQDFYDNSTYEAVAIGVRINDDLSFDKTIHKAKGDEFDNVLVVLKNPADIGFLANPDLNKEEHRVYYVASSRARERLFFTVPDINPAYRSRLSGLFDLIDMPKSSPA